MILLMCPWIAIVHWKPTSRYGPVLFYFFYFENFESILVNSGVIYHFQGVNNIPWHILNSFKMSWERSQVIMDNPRDMYKKNILTCLSNL
jgi:hypothetical protein